MSLHEASIKWERGDQPFLDQRYSRRHSLHFDGGLVIPASSSPHVVPIPWSDPTAIDPEEAFVASVSSCHMLWFLSIAAKRGYCVDYYIDEACGQMGTNVNGKTALTVITLRPDVKFSDKQIPNADQVEALHHEAHEACFIANSVLSEIRIEPVVTGEH